jgi:predicted benzoate:H+ symporter BenE
MEFGLAIAVILTPNPTLLLPPDISLFHILFNYRSYETFLILIIGLTMSLAIWQVTTPNSLSIRQVKRRWHITLLSISIILSLAVWLGILTFMSYQL